MNKGTLPASVVVLCLMVPIGLVAQTAVSARDMKSSTSPAGRVFVVLPTGRVVEADLDVSLVIDPPGTAGGRPVIRAVVQPGSVVQPQTVRFQVVVGQTDFALASTPVANSLLVTRNGLVLSEFDDYTRSPDGKTFTLLRAIGDVGEIVQARYL